MEKFTAYMKPSIIADSSVGRRNICGRTERDCLLKEDIVLKGKAAAKQVRGKDVLRVTSLHPASSEDANQRNR